jgi:hypothetical protein
MANGKKPTLQDIMADYDASMKAFGDAERGYQDRIDEIEGSPPPLTAAQKAERDKIVAAQKSCRAQMLKVDWATLALLNDMDNVKKLKSAFDSVNGELQKSLKEVQQIQKVAAVTAQVLAGVAKVAAQLAKFLV